MANGDKKILRCIGCNVAYNVTNLKPGSKFKCQRCETINVVPAEAAATPPAAAPRPSAPSKPPTAISPSAPPRKQPTATPTLPKQDAEEAPVRPSKITTATKSTAANRFSKLSKISGKSSKFKKLPTAQGTEDEINEEEGFSAEPKKKNKLLLIVGIVLVIVIIVVIIVLATKSKGGEKGKDKKNKKITEKTKSDKANKTAGPKENTPPEKTEWIKVDSGIKDHVKTILQGLDAPNNSEAAKLKMEFIKLGENGVAALIELYFDNLEAPLVKNVPTWIKNFTLQEPTKPERGKQKTSDEVMKWYKKLWLNKESLMPDYKYPVPAVVENIEKEMKEAGAAESAPAELKLRDAFKSLIKEDIRPGVLQILTKWSAGEIPKDDAIAKLNEIDKKEVVPILITEIANADALIGQKASEAVKQITGNQDIDDYNKASEGKKDDICRKWQDWWLENKDK